MKTLFKVFTAIVVAASLNAIAFAAEVSPTGVWKWTVQGRQGGQGFEQSMKLDYTGGKLSGTMIGRQGGQFSVPDTAIAEASFKDGVLKFTVTRQFNDRSFTTKYEGKIEGDTITGTFERPSFTGGEPTKNPWIAKREK